MGTRLANYDQSTYKPDRSIYLDSHRQFFHNCFTLFFSRLRTSTTKVLYYLHVSRVRSISVQIKNHELSESNEQANGESGDAWATTMEGSLLVTKDANNLKASAP